MLLDTNILILAGDPAHTTLRSFVRSSSAAVSAISYVEALGYHRLTAGEKDRLEDVFASAVVLGLLNPILRRAATLRQARRMSLGDAIIAATALHHDLTLVTHNPGDFTPVPGLRVLDPLA